MADKIRHKRSSTASAMPTAGQLELGELAINTADARVYLKNGAGVVKALALDEDTRFTIIYPNGGSAGSPANVASNTRYVMTNPFPGHHLICIAELRSPAGVWAEAGFQTNVTNGTGIGTRAGVVEDQVVVQTGSGGVASVSANTMGLHGASWPTGVISSAPCRVKVWKVKGAIA